MATDRDRGLVARIEDGSATGVLHADDPAEVAEAVARTRAAVCVELDVLPGAIAGARVRLAEVVVARARQAERDLAAVIEGGGEPRRPEREDGTDDGPHVDAQAVRFALVILVPALLGGIAVYLADGLVLAPALPAAALLAIAVVVLAHRRPASEPRELAPPVPSTEPVDVDQAAAVRAAEAHLRRQQAAWKVTWWERDEPVPDLGAWSPEPAAVPITLVAVDPAGDVDARAHATMTATVPAAVRVVVLQARG